jgi:hypothetical protein
MPPAGMEPATPLGDRPQNLALDRAFTDIGILFDSLIHI